VALAKGDSEAQQAATRAMCDIDRTGLLHEGETTVFLEADRLQSPSTYRAGFAGLSKLLRRT
jgi:hypothetical protein